MSGVRICSRCLLPEEIHPVRYRPGFWAWLWWHIALWWQGPYFLGVGSIVINGTLYGQRVRYRAAHWFGFKE